MVKIKVKAIFSAAKQNKYVDFMKECNYELDLYSKDKIYVGTDFYFGCDTILSIIKINSEYNVRCDYTELFANYIKFTIIEESIIDEIVNCLNYPSDINKILHCFTNESAIIYCCSKYNVYYDDCYLSCIVNKRDNAFLYEYLSEFVSDVNLFIPTIFDIIPEFTDFFFLNKLISKGLDCSYLHIDDSSFFRVFDCIYFDNIKNFCKMKISIDAYYKIITNIPSQKVIEFVTHCIKPDEIILDKKSRDILDIIDKFDISKDNLLLYLLNAYNACECEIDYD